MATLRDIKHRISSIKSTQKITKAMKMVAAAKLRRAQDSIIAARPYARKMKELLESLSSSAENNTNPSFVQRDVQNVALVIITSDRGLCGAFNTNIIKTAVNHINSNHSEANQNGRLHLIMVGKKGYDFFVRRNYKIDSKHINIFNNLNFQHARGIMNELGAGFLTGKYDKVEIIYNEFKSIIQQRINIEQLLPIPPELLKKLDAKNIRATILTDYIYEPSSKEIIDALVPKHLNFQMWRILLESNAAEQGARMIAMDSATTNANDLVRLLALIYNKARQAAITKELLEIVSGAEALKKAG
ncbi:MAG: ATP synthase F1 subunit gamma [Bacteroidetes bacterium]|nr:ATP synthase F1 subunit gamma [Bacteroidota bacterium]MBU1423390.1 ATP synthase F1 subunit gamma [Bacteroidota bacterium]MBU2470882.1 ATP synthase F1 subunit gamma [Bacteroidota bacterium]MBU2637098.1 ATP synthase F1 subunit gamma [Bacteroidota bacterium]